MCQGCWQERGFPSVVNDAVKAAAELIGGVYEHHGAGGGLHVIVDDWNLDDGTVAFCANYIESEEYKSNDDVTEERLEAERRCLRALKALTEQERGSALAIHDGYLKVYA